MLRDGAAVVTTLPLDGTGAASFSTTSLNVGVHTIALSYPGDANYAAATATLLETVQNASTQIVLTAGANPATYAQPLSLAAAITSNGGIASGTVTFTDGAATLEARRSTRTVRRPWSKEPFGGCARSGCELCRRWAGERFGIAAS